MARNIVDTADRTVGIPIRKFNPKWLVISFIVACVIGGSVGGYYLYNQVTSTANLPKPQIPSGVITPATPNETPIVQPMPVLNVAWEMVQLPSMSGFGTIMGLKIENSNTISVWRCIGPADGGKATLVALWKTEDNCKTWKEIEQRVVYAEDEAQLGLIPSSWSSSSPRSPLSSIQIEKEVLPQSVNPTISLSVVSKAQNGNNVLVLTADQLNVVFVQNAPGSIDGYWLIRQPDGFWETQQGLRDSSPEGYRPDKSDLYRLFLSTDDGKSWKHVNFPSKFARFDLYPETPELILLSECPSEPDYIWGVPHDIRLVEIISSDDGSINLFLVSPGAKGFFKGTIKSPN